MKKNFIELIIIFSLILSVVFISNSLMNTFAATINSSTIEVNYSIGTLVSDGRDTSNRVYDEVIDEDFNSLKLHEFNSDFDAWGKGTITEDSVTYEAAFAGWKLTAINDTVIDTQYLYPEHDNIYFLDEPFASYDGEITSLSFTALWGKTIYLRDRYNFNNLASVYADVDTALIDWDTTVTYAKKLSEDATAGNSVANPIDNFDEAMSLLGTNGGKIHIVNHYVFSAAENRYPYHPNFNINTSATTNIDIGKQIKNGTLTISGEGFGRVDGDNKEKSNESNTTLYDNAYLYFRNMQGLGTYKGTAYKGLTLYLRFYCDVVFEEFSMVGYRENYYDGQSRYTQNLYFESYPDKRFLMKDSIQIFKRTTIANKEAAAGVWTHATYEGLKGLTVGGSEFFEIISGTFGTITEKTNLYLTIYGSMNSYCSLQSIYIKPVVKANVPLNINNINVCLYKSTISSYYGINYKIEKGNHVNVNNYNIKFTDCTIGRASTVSNLYTAKIKNLKLIVDGIDATSSKKITTLFVGQYGNSSNQHQLITYFDNADVIVRGKAYISSLYGGSNEISAKTYFDKLNIEVRSGTITSLYGGGLGGPTKANKITMDITGGQISNVYGGGAGGVCAIYTSNSPYDAAKLTYDEEYKYFIGTDKIIHSVGRNYTIQNYAFNWEDGSSNTYDVIELEYLYPKQSITSLSSYYKTVTAACVSEAMVEVSDCIEINISGSAKVTKSVYGGGENGAVTGNIVINYEGGSISGNIFGGGKGSATSYSSDGVFKEYADTEFLFVNDANALTVDKNEKLLLDDFAGSKISNYSSARDFASLNANNIKTPLSMNKNDYANFNLISGYNSSDKPIVEVYSANIAQLGLINGDIEINVSSKNIKGNIYGGSDGVIASITGNSVVNVNNVDLSKITIYGGGNLAYVGGDTSVNLTSSYINEVYAGGNEGDVKGDSTITLDNSTVVTNLYGGGNHANTEGSIKVDITNGSKIESLFGGANQANVNENIEINIKDSKITNFYGANNQSGEVFGSVNSTINRSEVENVYGGGNYANLNNIVALTIQNSKGSYIYGGGNFASVGATNIEVFDSEYDYIYGGGNEGKTLYNVSLNIDNTTSIEVYGGANKADIGGTVYLIANNLDAKDIYGANNLSGDLKGNVSMNISNSNFENVFGGGNQAKFTKDITLISNNVIADNLYGGGNLASVGSTNVTINGGQYNYVYGGGNEGDTLNTVVINVSDAHINELFGGANNANIDSSVNLTVDNVTATDIYGANNISGEILSNINTTIKNSNVSNCIYGGGNKADFDNIATLTINNTSAKNIYGGGKEANVGSTDVKLTGVNVEESIFAGGDEGKVFVSCKLLINGNSETTNVYGGGKNASIGDSSITINSALINGNVYGGGFAGTSENTNVVIEDTANIAEVTIKGNVFAGGEGEDATVFSSTNLVINLEYSFNVEEKHITTNQETPSGASDIEVTTLSSKYSQIYGNVYGGGDLAQVGQGDIILSSNTAENVIAGTTNVTINNGFIGGSVFGGGNGVPKDTTYNIYMGAVFGNTTVNIYGGYIQSNVYGGGTQSRLYYGTKNKTLENVATVNIDETNPNGYQKIAIGGSVFGGGDRGSGASHNASVPTTVGNVEVNIVGIDNSQIYFVHGGVYGDGNFCLVSGERTINITDFNTGTAEYLKTFYSLQRADYVNLTNSKIVLLGAIDLVEEGDNTLYSINRVEDLSMCLGSTIKLDQIVKYLEYMSSDVNTDSIFIDKGNNGSNDFIEFGGNIPVNLLSQEDIYSYQQSKTIKKNDVCVANGLFLELRKPSSSDKITYGYLQGLFTLELLHANPGEGGGFVYADILNSKGTFICETVREVKYVEATNVTAENVSLYYVYDGTDYIQANSYNDSETYYKINYMNVIHDVSSFVNGVPTKYCWYIDGSTINYSTSLTGHIGSTQIIYTTNVNIPRHSSSLYYSLNTLSGNNTLNEVALNNTYNFKSNSNNLQGQDIAIEFTIGDLSLGFLTYENNNDEIIWKIDNKVGYHNQITHLEENLLTDSVTVDSTNENFNIVLHKSTGVDTEKIAMQLQLSLVIYDKIDGDYYKYNGGTCNLNFAILFNIQRLVPTQSSFSSVGKSYSGVALNEVINITGNSSFTMQYQTRYIPDAFPREGKNIYWALSTKSYSYYMDINGNSLTFEGNVLKHISDGLIFDGNVAGSTYTQETVYDDGYGNYYYIDGSNNRIEFSLSYSSTGSYIPKNTKITMVDMSSGNSQQYYYYICQEDETLINIDKFMQMGTTSTIAESSTKPFFMNFYTTGGSSRITEEVVFVFDFSSVTYENSSSFSGEISFAHLYGDNINNSIDIMDYVKTDIDSLGNRNFSRFYPLSTNFVLNPSSNGIDNFEVENDEEVYYKDSVDFTVNIDHSDDIVNSSTKDLEYSMKVEIIDSVTNEAIKLPTGMYIIYQGNKYYSIYDDKYILLPINDAGVHSFTIFNELVGFNEISLDNINVRLSLYLSGDSSYCNEFESFEEVVKVVSFNLHENPNYSINVEFDKLIVEAGDVIHFEVDKNVDGLEMIGQAHSHFEIHYKENGNYVIVPPNYFSIVYDSSTDTYSLSLS